jgi:hypothetical protein
VAEQEDHENQGQARRVKNRNLGCIRARGFSLQIALSSGEFADPREVRPSVSSVLEFANMETSYLWPGYSEDSSNFHVLLVVLIANVKTREHLSTWGK